MNRRVNFPSGGVFVASDNFGNLVQRSGCVIVFHKWKPDGIGVMASPGRTSGTAALKVVRLVTKKLRCLRRTGWKKRKRDNMGGENLHACFHGPSASFRTLCQTGNRTCLSRFASSATNGLRVRSKKDASSSTRNPS